MRKLTDKIKKKPKLPVNYVNKVKVREIEYIELYKKYVELKMKHNLLLDNLEYEGYDNASDEVEQNR
mgnify:FL=1